MVRWLLAFALIALPLFAFAEGNCPPGYYPIGGQGVVGCAPIPGSGTSAPQAAPRPTGKWETRWGAIVEDVRPSPDKALPTGYAVSQKSKREAVATATQQCKAKGGNKCEVRIAYHNQCVALADPEPVNGRIPAGLTSSAVGAADLEKAKSLALSECRAGSVGFNCEVTYSACSMSEFRKF